MYLRALCSRRRREDAGPTDSLLLVYQEACGPPLEKTDVSTWSTVYLTLETDSAIHGLTITAI